MASRRFASFGFFLCALVVFLHNLNVSESKDSTAERKWFSSVFADEWQEEDDAQHLEQIAHQQHAVQFNAINAEDPVAAQSETEGAGEDDEWGIVSDQIKSLSERAKIIAYLRQPPFPLLSYPIHSTTVAATHSLRQRYEITSASTPYFHFQTAALHKLISSGVSFRPLVTLVMIVKNEMRNMRRTLDSCLPYIDRLSIVDTGSTDGTLAFLEEYLHEKLSAAANSRAMEALLWQEPFIDFSTTRNRALFLAGNVSTFLLLLNGDDFLVHGDRFISFLQRRSSLSGPEEGMYIVPVRYGDSHWAKSERCIRSSNHFQKNWPLDIWSHWKFEGSTHEVYISNQIFYSGMNIYYVNEKESIDGWYILHDISGDTLQAKQSRFELDVELLKEELYHSSNNTISVNLPRTIYYLAQSYYNLKIWKESYWAYWLRTKVGYQQKKHEQYDQEKCRAFIIMADILTRLKEQHQSHLLEDLKKYVDIQSKVELLQLAFAACPNAYSKYLIAEELFHKNDLKEATAAARAAEKMLNNGGSAVECNEDDGLTAKHLPALLKKLKNLST